MTTRTPPAIPRRSRSVLPVLSLLPLLLLACSLEPEGTGPGTDPRLTARPGVPTRAPTLGESPLGLEIGRDGLLYVPSTYDPAHPAPLLVLLHGATGSASNWRGVFEVAGARGIVVLALDSRGATWDRIRGDFGPDYLFMDAALKEVFAQAAIDPSRIALAGFSDGATYALSLGVGNGDLFTHLMAFSPGFVSSGESLVGEPRIFVSHGREDPVLSVGASRDRIVPALRNAGYDVTYEEFDGGHAVPQAIFDTAMDWFME